MVITNIQAARNQAKSETRWELELLHKHGLYHIKHRHGINLQRKCRIKHISECCEKFKFGEGLVPDSFQ